VTLLSSRGEPDGLHRGRLLRAPNDRLRRAHRQPIKCPSGDFRAPSGAVAHANCRLSRSTCRGAVASQLLIIMYYTIYLVDNK
jgi:hypothetical protein